MPQQRIRATELARLLNSAERPIYVLDDEQTIVFCNQSLLTAIGPAATDLFGRRCTYRSDRELTGAEAVAAGLCPPPEAAAGRPMIATVSWESNDGALHQRRARFIPLNDARSSSASNSPDNDMLGLVVLVDTVDLQEAISPCVDEPELKESLELHRRLREFRHRAAGRYSMDRLVGDSPAICRARRQVELAASSRVGVLVYGPPGSGRQHVASAIHYAAAREQAESKSADSKSGDKISPDAAAGRSLIPLACSVLGEDLIRSTVAALAASPMGEATRQCTLLLNDADQLPQEVQAELAKLFSDRAFQPRLIATSRCSLDELARADKFNKDLAAILGTITIELPPLTERRMDIPLLAQMFVEQENAAGGKQIGGLSSEALDCLDAFDLPGNVDELALAIAHAHHQAATPIIAAADLPKRIHLAAAAAAHPHRAEETIVLDEFLAKIERELLERALQRAKGNKAKAARMLGLTRPRFYRRLVQLGLEEETVAGKDSTKPAPKKGRFPKKDKDIAKESPSKAAPPSEETENIEFELDEENIDENDTGI